MKYTKYMAAAAVSVGSLFYVSCGGDDVTVNEGASADEIAAALSASGAGDTTVTVESGGLSGVEDMKLGYFPLSDLKLTVESDANAGTLDDHEFSYDIDSFASADLDWEDGANTLNGSNEIIDIASGITYTDGDSTATIPFLTNLTLGGISFTDVVLSYEGVIGNTLYGTFAASGVYAAPITTTATGAENFAFGNITGGAAVPLLVSVEMNSASNTVQVNGTSYTLGVDQVLVRNSDGSITIFHESDVVLGGGATADATANHDATIHTIDFSASPAPTTSTGTIADSVAGAPVTYTTVLTNTSAITGTFRQDLDAVLFSSEPTVADSVQ